MQEPVVSSGKRGALMTRLMGSLIKTFPSLSCEAATASSSSSSSLARTLVAVDFVENWKRPQNGSSIVMTFYLTSCLLVVGGFNAA